MRNVFIFIFLVGLAGCPAQRTFSIEGLRPNKMFNDRREFQGYLADVARKVCIAHLGSEEKIAIAATQQGQWVGDQNVYLGDQGYVRSSYVLKGAYKRQGDTVFARVSHAGSATCSISVSQKMHIPQYFHKNLVGDVEQVLSFLMPDQGVEVIYGFRGASNYHVRQFSTHVEGLGTLDYYEFMTLDAFMRALDASSARGGILQNNIETLYPENEPS